jgi:hypothetical protein
LPNKSYLFSVGLQKDSHYRSQIADLNHLTELLFPAEITDIAEIFSVIGFAFRFFDFRLPPSRLGKTQANLVLLSLLCRFRLFRYKNYYSNKWIELPSRL